MYVFFSSLFLLALLVHGWLWVAFSLHFVTPGPRDGASVRTYYIVLKAYQVCLLASLRRKYLLSKRGESDLGLLV